MTVDQLIAEVLNNLRNHFYADRLREFKRDERALMKAIATYGHECNQRNWQFQAGFIYRDIMDLLRQIRMNGQEIQYLPVYLAGTIRRHIGQRAEELSAEAKKLPPKVSKIVAGVRTVEAIREPTAVEVLDTLYKSIKRRRKPTAEKPKQKELL